MANYYPRRICKKEYIENWFIEQSKHFVIQKVTYDPAKAFRLNKALEAHGFETEVVRQGAITLGPAVDDVKELFIDGQVIFSYRTNVNEKAKINKLFRWYVNNVKMKPDRKNNMLPQKQGRYRKIDGFAAFLNAHTEVMKLMVEPAGMEILNSYLLMICWEGEKNLFKLLHKFFSMFGLSLGGASACIKYECKEYCGLSPSQLIYFEQIKAINKHLTNIIK